jgi:putative hydrolase of the HAD superfamily
VEIAPFFDAILISEAEGLRKPDRRIFELAVSPLGVSPSDLVFVGDHPWIDIRCAQRACVRAIWKRDVYWGACPFAEGVIDELPELCGLLTIMRAYTN